MPTTANTTQVVNYLLNHRNWITPYQIQAYLKDVYGHLASESSITARIREMRQVAPVEKRLKKNSTAYEYRLVN